MDPRSGTCVILDAGRTQPFAHVHRRIRTVEGRDHMTPIGWHEEK